MTHPAIMVALVDDDASVRKAIGRLLTASRFDIRAFGSAREFLRSLKTEMPQCLVVDLHMPDLSGLDLQRHLGRAKVKIPTIVITAYNEPGIRERCRAAGASDFLLKPVSGASLVAAINSALSQEATEVH